MKFWLSLILLFVLAGCTGGVNQNGPSGGGIEVGNGMQNSYYSEQYGFTLRYSPRLRATEISAEHVIIDNSPVIAELNNPKLSPSSLEFVGSPAETKDIKDTAGLADFVKKTFGPRGFTIRPADKGQEGTIAEKSEKGTLSAFYYFFSPSGKVLKFVVSALIEASGFDLVAPVIKTLSYDGVPPKISEVSFGEWPEKPVSGDTLSLNVIARDENSGLIGGKLEITLVTSDSNAGSSVIEFSQRISVKDLLKDDFLQFSIPTGPYRPTGNYIAKRIALSDLAGNTIEYVAAFLGKDNKWHPATEKSGYQQASAYLTRDSFGNLSNDIADKLIGFHLEATKPDTEPPKYIDLKFEPVLNIAKFPAVTRFVGTLRATDDVSGVVGGKILIRFCTAAADIDFRSIPGFKMQHAITEKQKIAPDTYRIEITAPPHAPERNLFACSIELTDAAGNEIPPTFDEKAALTIKNVNPPDLAHAEIFDSSVYPNEVKIGGVGSFRVRLVDNISVIGGKFEAVLIPKEPSPSSSEIHISQEITENNRFANDEYRFEFRATPFLRPGKYILSDIGVTDRAGNGMRRILDTYNHPWDKVKGKFAPKWEVNLPDFSLVP